jgi:hypothetical protein
MHDAQVEMAERLEGLIRAQMVPGEQLLGMLTASDTKVFTQQMYAIGVTPDRLIMVPVSLRWQAKGEPYAISKGEVVSTSESLLTTGGDGGSFDPGITVGSKVKLRTSGGRKLKLIPNDVGTFPGGGTGAFRRWLEEAQQA